MAGAGLVGCGGRPAFPSPSPETCATDPGPTSFTLTRAEVTIVVTKNGGLWEVSPTLQLASADPDLLEDTYRPSWTATSVGNGRYSVAVPVGTYDVRMNGGDGLVGTLAAGVRVDGPSSLAYDFQTVMVTGTVRFRGGSFPPEPGASGSICFYGPALHCADLGGGATFAYELVRGASYEVSWSHGGRVDSGAPTSLVPYGSQELGARTFDRDTAIDLDVDAPSVVVQGQVTVDDAGVTLPVELSIGPLVVSFAEGSAGRFSVPLLAGTYLPTFYLPTATGFVYRAWPGCAAGGCQVTADAEWVIDVDTTPPRGTVEGTIDFAVAPGSSVPAVSGQDLGSIVLRPSEGASAPFHGSGFLVTHLDSAARFTLTEVPYGTYAVSFGGFPLQSTPGGLHAFEATLVVDRARVTWAGSVPLVPVVVDVQVNGRPMADDSLVDGETRGALLFSRPGDDPVTYGYALDFGETGPARFERLMVPGRYQVAVDSAGNLGRTHRRGYSQDVLPVGEHDLGVVEIAAAAGAQGPARLAFDLRVTDARIQISGADLIAPSRPPFTMVRLVSGPNNLAWTEIPDGGGSVSVRLYSGCYGVDVYATDLPGYPNLTPPGQMARVGRYCTCDASP